jgi:hypothetical protein
MLIRRDAFESAGPFSTDRRLPEFVEWYGRAIDAGIGFAVLPQVVLRRRIHDANMTTVARPDYLRAIKASLDRRRRA